jgi:DNA replication protein DnaC
MSVEPTLLTGYLNHLRLTTFSRNYAQFAQDAAAANQSYAQFLLALSREEVAHRDHNRQLQRIRAAKFPLLKELIDFDFSAIPQLNKHRILELARGEYLAKAEPIILVGNPGLGKTHIATGLGLAACAQQHRVRFYNAAALVNDLTLAQQAGQLPKLMTTALKQQLIIIDELGFIPFSATGAQLIFQFCSTLYERVALIITTNLNFADWTQVFGSEKLTLALLDRLTHRAHIIEFVGESYRFRQRWQQPPPKGEA